MCRVALGQLGEGYSKANAFQEVPLLPATLTFIETISFLKCNLSTGFPIPWIHCGQDRRQAKRQRKIHFFNLERWLLSTKDFF
jgi:hypothetical protein